MPRQPDRNKNLSGIWRKAPLEWWRYPGRGEATSFRAGERSKILLTESLTQYAIGLPGIFLKSAAEAR